MMGLGDAPILLFHPGKQHSPQTALALQQLGRLKTYATSIFYDRNRFPYWLDRLPGRLGRRLHSEFSRFSHPEIDPTLVKTWGMLEWLERISLRLGAIRLSYQLDRLGNRLFANGLIDEIRSNEDFALWGYNGSSIEAFRIAKAMNRVCILDRTIGDYRYFNEIMAEQQELYPRYFERDEKFVSSDRIDLDDQEYEIADRIVVGSEYCKNTIITHSKVANVAEKISVVPYCVNNHDFFDFEIDPKLEPEGPVKFIFVGRITPRKGIHILLEAFSKLPPGAAHLTLLGKMLIPADTFAPFSDRVEHIPSVAPSAVAQVMARHHVLVLPSFFEGSAITLLEGLSCGLGIIQSPQAGNGASQSTGIVLKDNTVQELYEAMLFAVENRDLVSGWRSAARNCRDLFEFEGYKNRIANFLKDIG